MSSSSNVLGTTVEDVVASALQPVSDTVYVIAPSRDVVEAFIDFGADADGSPRVRILSEESLLKDVLSDFLVASNAAALVDDGVLDLRVTDDRFENTLLVTESSVVAVVAAGDHVAGLTTDDAAFVRSANETYTDSFEASEPFALRTPSISAVRDSLESEFGADVRADFDAVLESLRDADGKETTLDEVTVSLLVAAKHDVLLYDISKWGEDVGVASKATFSRTKTELEDIGLIETEKVPIDVGRPRLRLRLGDDRLVEADVDQLAAVARDILE
ncbi:transcriptional regulator TbsP [Halobellus litoreus]|uniref:Transcriptional regulator TbsP n=1 Tax=Halobellus litoreus TaxID=755310 RepID=A0ABD6E5P8_9EURY|nr:DUF5821 family protein [Halobellus litoreus]